MPHVVNCIAFYSLDFTNICFKYHERKKPVHTFCTPIFHGILKCDKVCSCIAALHHLLVLDPHFYAKVWGWGRKRRFYRSRSRGALRCCYPTHRRQSTYKSRPFKANHARPFPVVNFSSDVVILPNFGPDAHVISSTLLSLHHKTSG